MPVSTLDARTALVVIDLQNGLMGRPTLPYPTDEVVARSVALADAFRARDLPVVLVRVSYAADGADAAPGRADLSGPPRPRPEGWDTVVPELSGHEGDVRITKHNWGAFHDTGLDLQLRRRGVTQVVFTGVATSIGVESSARAAHEHGYHVTVATDAVTDIAAEPHRNSVERIFPMFAETGTTAEILEMLAKTHPAG